MPKRKRGRPPSPIPMADLHIWLPVHIITTVDTMLLDPVYAQVPYGARSRYVQQLITDDLRARGFNLSPPVSGTEESST